MKTYNITAVNKEHFNSLIKDYQKNGFNLYFIKKNHAELKNENEIIIIEF